MLVLLGLFVLCVCVCLCVCVGSSTRLDDIASAARACVGEPIVATRAWKEGATSAATGLLIESTSACDNPEEMPYLSKSV